MDESITSNSSSGQSKFNELTKEELVTKCNKLLWIARNAKKTKDGMKF